MDCADYRYGTIILGIITKRGIKNKMMGRLKALQGVAVLCGVLKRKTVFRLIFVLSKKNLKKNSKKIFFLLTTENFNAIIV